MFQWLKTLLVLAKKPARIEEPPHHVVIEQEVVIVSEPVIEEKDSHERAAFLHTRKRLRERYGYYLKEEMYQEWHTAIKNNKAQFVHSLEGNARLYMVEMYNKNVFVVFDEGMIKTVLPFNPEWVRKARSHQKPKGKASKQVGRGNLDRR